MGLKIVAGLGNPGAEYARTPHNAGFGVVDRLAVRLDGSWREHARFKASLARVRSGGADLLLAKPQTFMNASGEAVGALMRYYGASAADLVVVSDDADHLDRPEETRGVRKERSGTAQDVFPLRRGGFNVVERNRTDDQ